MDVTGLMRARRVTGACWPLLSAAHHLLIVRKNCGNQGPCRRLSGWVTSSNNSSDPGLAKSSQPLLSKPIDNRFCWVLITMLVTCRLAQQPVY